jgi:hypothetical protein
VLAVFTEAFIGPPALSTEATDWQPVTEAATSAARRNLEIRSTFDLAKISRAYQAKIAAIVNRCRG